MAELRLVFVVGEASGDTLAAEMVDGIRARGHDVTISGIGGRRLQERGLIAVSPMESLTVIGIGQALAAVSRLNRLADQLIAHVIETRPDAIITVDSKGFNLRFARRLRARLKRGLRRWCRRSSIQLPRQSGPGEVGVLAVWPVRLTG